jgi:hypothetical protein
MRILPGIQGTDDDLSRDGVLEFHTVKHTLFSRAFDTPQGKIRTNLYQPAVRAGGIEITAAMPHTPRSIELLKTNGRVAIYASPLRAAWDWYKGHNVPPKRELN